MKILKPLIFLPLLAVMSSCSNNELGYNEKTTSLFLNEMKQVDEAQKTFADSAHVLHPDSGDKIMLGTSAETLEKNAQQDIQNMNDLKPSEAATDFHKGVLAYFTKIKTYGATATQLAGAADDKKAALYTQLMDEYKDLNQMPDQLLETQKAYMAKVGLKAK